MLQMMLVLAVSAPNIAPPVAPPPRAVAPKLSVTSGNGRVELRWASGGTSYVAVGSEAVFGNGVLTITGSSDDGILLVSPQNARKAPGRLMRLEISLSDGTPTWRKETLPPPETKFARPN